VYLSSIAGAGGSADRCAVARLLVSDEKAASAVTEKLAFTPVNTLCG